MHLNSIIFLNNYKFVDNFIAHLLFLFKDMNIWQLVQRHHLVNDFNWCYDIKVQLLNNNLEDENSFLDALSIIKHSNKSIVICFLVFLILV